MALFSDRHIRRLFVLTAVLFLALPLATVAMVYPIFSSLLTDASERDSLRLARLLGNIVIQEGTSNLLLDRAREQAHTMREDSGLLRLRILLPDGDLVFSSEKGEVAFRNTNPYFTSMVATGKPISMFIRKNSRNFEGEAVHADIVESYVPVQKDGRTIAIIETYFDVARQLRRLFRAFLATLAISLSTAAGSMGLVILALRRADQAATSRRRAEDALQSTLERLEDEVKSRTAELEVTNAQLRREIDDRTSAELLLLENEEKLRKITTATQDAIVMADQKGRISFWNESAERIFGYRGSEAEGKLVHELIVPERYRSEAVEGFLRYQTSGTGPILGKIFEISALRKDNSEFPVEMSLSSVKIKNEWHSVAFVRDITERRAVQKALYESMARFRLLFEQSLNPILLFDRSTAEILDMNARCMAMFGVSKAELFSGGIHSFFSRADAEQLRRHFQTSGEEGFFVMENRTIRLRDGSEIVASVHGRALRIQDQDVVFCTFHDHTEEVTLAQKWRMSMERLVQSEKMSFLGTMVSSFAHDINNPNQLIALNIPILERIWQDARSHLEVANRAQGGIALGGLPFTVIKERLPEMFSDMKAGSVRISEFVNNLLNFARENPDIPKTDIDMNRIVENAVRLLRHRIKNSTNHFSSTLARDLPAVKGNRSQLEQIVVNLLVNALESLPSPESVLSVTTALDPGTGRVLVTVRDRGIGMPQEVIAKACEAFFTTKQAVGGSGLGLAICDLFAREHGGLIKLESVPGEGTTATLILPSGQGWSDHSQISEDSNA